MSPLSHASQNTPVDLTASIVTYRNPERELRAAVESVARQPVQVRLMLVDNASDDTVARLAEETGALYLRTGANLGFGKAHNLAYAQLRSQSDFHLVLNPDVHFDGDVLGPLLTVMRQQAEFGVVMPKILYPDGATQHLCKRLPTPQDLVIRRFGSQVAQQLFRRSLERYEMLDRDYDAPMQPATLSGCFLLLRNAVIDRVGLFDERYFMYMEDVDLMRRIWRVSRALYMPSVSIVHGYRKGSYRQSHLAWRHMRSAIQYFSKWGWLLDRERDALNARL